MAASFLAPFVLHDANVGVDHQQGEPGEKGHDDHPRSFGHFRRSAPQRDRCVTDANDHRHADVEGHNAQYVLRSTIGGQKVGDPVRTER